MGVKKLTKAKKLDKAEFAKNDWISIPASCGKGLLAQWLQVEDISRFDIACCSHGQRMTFLHWCDKLIVQSVGFQFRNRTFDVRFMLSWLSERNIRLMDIDFSWIDGHGTLSALQSYLRNHGSAVRSFHFQFFYDLEVNISHRMKLVELLLDLEKTSPHLEKLSIGVDLSDSALTALRGSLSNLTSLRCWKCKRITSESFQMVGQFCSKLRELYVTECDNICDAGLIAVSMGCPLLEILNCNLNPHLSGEGLGEAVSRLELLVKLWLPKIDTAVVDGIDGHLTRLQSMYANDAAQVEDSHVERIFRTCTSLTSLHMQNCPKLTNAGLSHVRNLTSLELLNCPRIDWLIGDVLVQRNPALTTLRLWQFQQMNASFVMTVLRGCPLLCDVTVTTTLGESKGGRSQLSHMAETALKEAFPRLSNSSLRIRL